MNTPETIENIESLTRRIDYMSNKAEAKAHELHEYVAAISALEDHLDLLYAELKAES